MNPNSSPTMIDLFAGCGGVTSGFKAAGFDVLAAVEYDPIVARTYRLNHPEVILYEEDIRNLSPEEMMNRCRLKPGDLTVLTVCAPCQPFSRQNRFRETDPRADLILEAVRFTEVLLPVFVFIENVPGLKNNSDILNKLTDGLKKAGYKVKGPVIVDAVDYGVPQFRKRLILLATGLDIELGFPEGDYTSPEKAVATGKKKWLTVRDAFKDLPSLGPGEACKDDPLHKARKHSPLSLERLRNIPVDGGGRESLPDELQPACHRNPKVGYNDVYGRMYFDRPSNTLTTGCTNFTKGRFAHPVENRAITPREAARLQTFPDTYVFAGSYDKISAQIGNAVPVRLAEAFAEHFHKLWLEFGRSSR